MNTFLAKWLVPNWKEVLWKEYSSYLLLLGAAIPDLVNLILDNWELVSSVLGTTQMDDGYKSGIRLTFILLAFGAKFVNQKRSVEPPLDPEV